MLDLLDPGRARRRRHAATRRSAATSPSTAAGSSRSAISTGRGAERTIDADGRVVCPGLRRPAQPQRLHAAHESDRREHDPPGRDDRGRRQLRLDLCAGLASIRSEFIEATAADVRLRRPGRVGDRSPIISASSRAIGHSQNLAWFVGHNTIRYAAGVFERPGDRGAAASGWRATSPRRCMPARSVSRPGSSSSRAGRRRPTRSSA